MGDNNVSSLVRRSMITFFFPEKNIGGVQNLIYNITVTLFHKFNIKVKIIDYNDGYVTKRLKSAKIDFKHYDYEMRYQNPTYIENNDTVIITNFSNHFTEYCDLKNINPKILYWNVFPTGLGRINKLKGRWGIPFYSHNQTRKIIHVLFKKKSLYFMSNNGVEYIKNKLNISYDFDQNNSVYIPVPIHIWETNLFFKSVLNRKSSKISISYIGRGDKWKILPLISFIRDLIISKKVNMVILYIITQDEGMYQDYIKKNFNINELPLIKYCNNLHGTKLSDFLLNNIWLNISMGTAALESSVLGIPTILIDASYNLFPSTYKYRWLFECQKFDLGRIINKGDVYFAGQNISEIIAKVMNYKKINEISNKCYRYTNTYHSSEKVVEKIINSLNKTQARIEDIYPFLIISKLKNMISNSLSSTST
jgi:hypothetical protein